MNAPTHRLLNTPVEITNVLRVWQKGTKCGVGGCSSNNFSCEDEGGSWQRKCVSLDEEIIPSKYLISRSKRGSRK